MNDYHYKYLMAFMGNWEEEIRKDEREKLIKESKDVELLEVLVEREKKANDILNEHFKSCPYVKKLTSEDKLKGVLKE